VHLINTYSGLPYHDESVDHHRTGDFSDVSEEEVRNALVAYSNIRVHQIHVREKTKIDLGEPIVLAHIDVDTYLGTTHAFEAIADQMASASYVVVDDYCYWSCPGVQLAVDEFCRNRDWPVLFLAPFQAVAFVRIG
jgi:Macrocin-O-methyltransferase (TylF)